MPNPNRFKSSDDIQNDEIDRRLSLVLESLKASLKLAGIETDGKEDIAIEAMLVRAAERSVNEGAFGD